MSERIRHLQKNFSQILEGNGLADNQKIIDLLMEQVYIAAPNLRPRQSISSIESASKVIDITPYLSVGIHNSKIYTYVNGERLIHCRHLFITAPIETPIDDMDDLIKYYSDKGLNAKFKIYSGSGLKKKNIIEPEVQLWVHASNIQAWVESGYNPRVIDSQLSRIILPKLVEHDSRALDKLLLCLKEEWITGNEITRRALLGKRDPFYGLIILLTREGDLPVEEVKKFISNVDYIIEKLADEEWRVFMHLDRDQYRWKIDYLIDYPALALEDLRELWNNGTYDERSQLLNFRDWTRPNIYFGALIKLTADGLVSLDSVKPHVSYIEYLVDKYGTFDTVALLNLRQLQERIHFHKRVSYHEKKIYFDEDERNLARKIRDGHLSTIVSDPKEYPALCWSKPFPKGKRWFKIIPDGRKLLWKSIREINKKYKKTATHVYHIKRDDRYNVTRMIRCLIRFEDKTFKDKWLRM